MKNILPSVEIKLPSDWSLITKTGKLSIENPTLWVDCKNPKGQTIQYTDPIQQSGTVSNQIHGLLLRFQGNEETWKHIKNQCLLGFTDDRSGPIFGGSFNPKRPYLFTAFLTSSQLTLLSLISEDASQIQNHFISGSIAAELQNERSYRLSTVTQTLEKNPNIELGLTMDWS